MTLRSLERMVSRLRNDYADVAVEHRVRQSAQKRRDVIDVPAETRTREAIQRVAEARVTSLLKKQKVTESDAVM